MIVFDLVCEDGHRFEGWFADVTECERELSEGLVSCPVCGNASVTRIPSTFGIKGAARSEGPPALPNPMEMLKHISDMVKANFDNVGANFATEALKIHYGVAEPRNIRGSSTQAEEKMLKDEGVEFLKVPVIPTKDTDA